MDYSGDVAPQSNFTFLNYNLNRKRKVSVHLLNRHLMFHRLNRQVSYPHHPANRLPMATPPFRVLVPSFRMLLMISKIKVKK